MKRKLWWVATAVCTVVAAALFLGGGMIIALPSITILENPMRALLEGGLLIVSAFVTAICAMWCAERAREKKDEKVISENL